MKRIFVFSMMLLVSFFFYSRAEAEHYVFVTLEFPPLEYTGEDGVPHGSAVEIVTHIMNRLGHTIDIRVYPWTRALKMVELGEVDGIFTAYKNPEREAFLDYSHQVLIPQIVCFYVKKGSPITFAGDLHTLKDKKIGVTSTISYGQTFDQLRPQLQVARANRLEKNFQKLLLEHIDLVISNVYVADTTLRELQLTDAIVRLPHEVERVPSYIAFSKKRGLTTLRDHFDQELLNMKTRCEYTTVMRKYVIDMQ